MEQKPIKEVVQMLNLYFKQKFIATGMGISTSTLGNKLKGNITKATDDYVVISRFTETDVLRFNQWMPQLAEWLRANLVTWSADRQAVVDQVNRIKPALNIYYIAEKFLGMNKNRIRARCENTSTKIGNSSFSQQDIDNFNSFLTDMASVVEQIEAQ